MNNVVVQLCSEPDIKLASGQISHSRKISEYGNVTKVDSKVIFLEDSELIHFFETLNTKIANPEYIWTPALCPEDGDVIGDHAFRSPAIILQNNTSSFSLIPDLETLGEQREQIKMFMSLNSSKASIGFADYECRPHVYYRLTGKALKFSKGHVLKLSYYILSSNDVDDPMDISRTLSFLWNKYASKYKDSTLPQKLSLDEYADMAYKSALGTGDFVEFKTLKGKNAGGFNTGSAKNTKNIESSYFKVPPKAIWFHSWFNSFRTAFGLKYYAGKFQNQEYSEAANKVKELLLEAPDILDNGLIPALYDYENKEWWCGVTRLGAGKDIFNLTTPAHSAQWMLLWNRYIEKDARLYERVKKTAETYIDLQAENGAFPGYMDKNGNILNLLKYSGHSGMASLLLCEFYENRKDEKILKSIIKSCEFYIKEIIPESKYHDFETFFSCSEKALDFYDNRTKQNAQNNLCLYWITETLLRAYSFSKDTELLKWGLHCLDRLSLYQQVWNPPYISLYTFGGFGVMNTDGEWNDTRQAYFADTYLLAYKLTGKEEYLQRGTAALRAGCALICHPEHKDTNPIRYDCYPIGLAPENYAHCGIDGPVHRSGFDWGAGALAAMTALINLKYPQVYSSINAIKG